MDTNRAFWSTTRLAHLSLAVTMLAASAAPALAQGGAPAAPDSAAARPAPVAAATPAARALGCADGERDADNHHDPIGYLIAGAVTGPIGVGIASWRRPKPHAAALAGQSPDATLEYSRCYGARARRHNVKAASNGFAVAAIVAIAAFAYTDSKTAP